MGTDPEPDDESTEQALQLPSLGFGRKRKDRGKDQDEPTESGGGSPTAPREQQPAVAAPPEPASEPEPAPAPEPEPEPVAEAPPVAPEPEPTREPIGKMVADLFRKPPQDEPDDGGSTRVQEPVPAGGGWSAMTGAPAETETTTRPAGDQRTRKKGTRPSVTLPQFGEGRLTARLAAGVVGALAGLLMIGGTVLALGSCELLRGTSSCGGGPGLFVILVLTATVVLAGAAALRLTGVPYPGMISFLGVGVVVVIVLLFLLPVIFSPVMIVLIPLLTGAAFVLAHAMSASFGEWNGPDWR